MPFLFSSHRLFAVRATVPDPAMRFGAIDIARPLKLRIGSATIPSPPTSSSEKPSRPPFKLFQSLCTPIMDEFC